MRNKILQVWKNFTPREQHFLLGGITLILIIFIYLFIWSPIDNKLDNIKQNIQQQTKLLNWLYKQEVIIAKLRSSESYVRPENKKINLITTINRSLKKDKLLSVNPSINANNDKTIVVSFKRVEFDRMINWLQKLVENYDANVEQASANYIPALRGIVAANIQFQQKSSN